MPNGFFKYFSADPDKLERFTNSQIYLTPPKYLNDPWEFLLRSEPPTEERLRAAGPFLDPESIAEFRRRTSSADWLEEGARIQREILSQITGLVCLTEKPLDRLMWAHYGESHRGFVAEFAHSADEAKTALEFRVCGSPFGAAAKVNYRLEQPLLKKDASNEEEILLTKHVCWNCEEEWRVIRPLCTGHPHPARKGFVVVSFEPTHLVRVILGAQAAPEVRLQLRQMLGHHEFDRVHKEEAYISPNSRQLESRPLSW